MKKIILLKESGSYNSQSCMFIKTRHREHYIGSAEELGLAHQSWNLNYRSTYFVPMLIHILEGYDSHLILKHMPKEYAKKVQIVPSNMQNFISFSLNHMKFLDSYRFLDSSLDTLTHKLNKTKREFRILESF